MIPNRVNHVHPVHRFFLCGLAALREGYNPVNLVHLVNNSGLFDYDDLGPSVRKIDAVAGQTTLYYNDPEWRVLAEYDAANNQLRKFIYGNTIDEVLVLNNLNGNDGSFWIRRPRSDRGQSPWRE